MTAPQGITAPDPVAVDRDDEAGLVGMRAWRQRTDDAAPTDQIPWNDRK